MWIIVLSDNLPIKRGSIFWRSMVKIKICNIYNLQQDFSGRTWHVASGGRCGQLNPKSARTTTVHHRLQQKTWTTSWSIRTATSNLGGQSATTTRWRRPSMPGHRSRQSAKPTKKRARHLTNLWQIKICCPANAIDILHLVTGNFFVYAPMCYLSTNFICFFF